MRKSLYFAVFFPCFLFAAVADAHIRLMSPTARFVQDDNGLKTAPCGSGTATGTVTKLTPGQALTVTWKESVSHAGHYRIALSANQSDFVEPTDLTIPNPLPSWDLVDGIQDKTGTQTYSQSVQVPNKECPACVLQLIQVMSTGTDGTNTGPFSGVYHACADVSVSAASGDGGATGDLAVATDAGRDLALHDLGPTRDTDAATDASLGIMGGSGGNTGNGGGGTSVATTSTAESGGGRGGGGGGASGAPGGGGRVSTGGAGDAAGGGAARGATANGGASAGGTSGGGGQGGNPGTSAATNAPNASGGHTGGAGNTGRNSSAPTSASGCSVAIGSPRPPEVSAWFAFLALGLTLLRRPRRRP